jgi:methylenetetrahydrofolate dehydrogenase (NADP+)/methenyltetrahydrofolate cyclohydrolase
MPCAWASGQQRLEGNDVRDSDAQLMDGTSLAKRIVDEAAAKAAEISRRTGSSPCLATVLVGEDPASATYVRMKRARCA